MANEGIEVPYVCRTCSSTQTISHTLSEGAFFIRFSSSFRCCQCGVAFEACGHIDDLPDELRSLFYEKNGYWRLRLVDWGSDRVAVLRALRKALPLTVAATGELMHKLPGTIAQGTRTEMEILKKKLDVSGAVLEIAPVFELEQQP